MLYFIATKLLLIAYDAPFYFVIVYCVLCLCFCVL